MQPLFGRVDNLLRGRGDGLTLGQGASLGIAFGLLYGAAMGCFGGFAGERALQVVFSSLKVPMLLFVTFILALPSFFVLNTLVGVRNDFAEVLSALLETQAGVALVLASLAPLTLVFYFAAPSYEAAVLFNLLMFSVASISGQVILRRRYRALIARQPLHQKLFWTWLGCYGFLGTQMGWVLRPFIGAPDAPVRFFREGAWGNVYEVLFGMVWKLIF
jgi:hypothetical protein